MYMLLTSIYLFNKYIVEMEKYIISLETYVYLSKAKTTPR